MGRKKLNGRYLAIVRTTKIEEVRQVVEAMKAEGIEVTEIASSNILEQALKLVGEKRALENALKQRESLWVEDPFVKGLLPIPEGHRPIFC